MEEQRNARAWCSIHECNPSDCFRTHNPTAYREKEKDVQSERPSE